MLKHKLLKCKVKDFIININKKSLMTLDFYVESTDILVVPL